MSSLPFRDAVLAGLGASHTPRSRGLESRPSLFAAALDEGLKAESAALVGVGSSDGDRSVASEATPRTRLPLPNDMKVRGLSYLPILSPVCS